MEEKAYEKALLEFYPEEGSPDAFRRREFAYTFSPTLEAAIGVASEAGEVLDLVKKAVFHGKMYDRSEMIKEMGDVLNYLTRLAYLENISLDYVRKENIAKLKTRVARDVTYYSHTKWEGRDL